MSAEAPAGGTYFLSYSRSDEQIALRLADDLRAGGVAMWVDQLDIRPSEHWDRAIERAVRDCRGLVVVLSPRSVASENVGDEICFAIDNGKSVLPVMIERCVLPLRLTRMQTIDATGDYERAVQQCLQELARRDGAAPAEAPARAFREPLDPADLELAKRRLTPILGPIAGKLVDRAARQSNSIRECYENLSNHVDEAEREHFLRLAGVTGNEPKQPVARSREGDEIPPADVERIARLMARYIGPIAPVVVKREAQVAGSLDELRDRLAGLIGDSVERAEFLRQAGS